MLGVAGCRSQLYPQNLGITATSKTSHNVYYVKTNEYPILGGIVLALVSILTIRSRKHGSTKENELLSHTQ